MNRLAIQRPRLHLSLFLATAAALAPFSQTYAQKSAPQPAPGTVVVEKRETTTITVYEKAPPAKANPQGYVPVDPNIPNIEGFKAAYERAGEPKILVICGIDSRPMTGAVSRLKIVGGALNNVTGYSDIGSKDIHEGIKDVEKAVAPAPRAATGNTGNNSYVGSNISLFDPTGDSAVLKNSIEEWLRENKDIELVNLDALSERDRREANLLEQREESRAVALLAQKVNADVVLVVKMLNNTLVRERAGMWRVTVDVVQPARGRSIGGFAFDWTEGSDAGSIKQYARAISRKFIEQFIAFYGESGKGPAQKYSVLLVGLQNGRELTRARQAFEKIPGVAKISGEQFSSDKQRSISSMTIRYTGRPIDLMAELEQSASSDLGMTVNGSDGAAGTITLIADPRKITAIPRPEVVLPPPAEAAPAPAQRPVDVGPPAAPAPAPAPAPARVEPSGPPASFLPTESRDRGPLYLSNSDPRGLTLRQLFTTRYRAAGSPKIAFMITREVTEAERKDPAVVKELGAAAEAGAKSAAGGEHLGVYLNPVGEAYAASDLGSVERGQAALLDTQKLESAMATQWSQNLGVTVIDPAAVRSKSAAKLSTRKTIAADEALFTVGKAAEADIVIQGVARLDPSDKARPVSYSFRAVRVADGVLLAAEPWPATLGKSAATETTIEGVAAYATGMLAEQMSGALAVTAMFNVVVENAAAQRDIFTLMTAIKANVAGVDSVDFQKFEGNSGAFTIRYSGSSDELVQGIKAAEKKLPFAMGSATKDSVTLKIKDQL